MRISRSQNSSLLQYLMLLLALTCKRVEKLTQKLNDVEEGQITLWLVVVVIVDLGLAMATG